MLNLFAPNWGRRITMRFSLSLLASTRYYTVCLVKRKHLQRLESGGLFLLICTFQPSSISIFLKTRFNTSTSIHEIKKAHSGRGEWGTVGGALQCVMFLYGSYWRKQARLLGSQCVCETVLTVIQAASGKPPPRDHILKTVSLTNPFLIWLTLWHCH